MALGRRVTQVPNEHPQARCACGQLKAVVSDDKCRICEPIGPRHREGLHTAQGLANVRAWRRQQTGQPG